MSTGRDRARTKVLGWGLIGLIGVGATVAALVLLATIVVVADTLVLAKAPVGTSYLTVVRQKGMAYSGDGELYIYELKDAAGALSDAQLPWVAQPGDRIRIRQGRTRILRVTLPMEAPVLCPAAQPCD